MTIQQRVAIFGASGAIGTALVDWFVAQDYEVSAFNRTGKVVSDRPISWFAWDGKGSFPSLSVKPFNAVVWAQGANCNDDIHSFDLNTHQQLYTANVLYIVLSLQALLKQNLLVSGSRLCVISSIWQKIGRPNKLSYCMTKAALQGLIQSLMIDLGADGHLINAVLPGALDTPMTRANLSEEQITQMENMTPLKALPTLIDIVNVVGFLCSHSNTGTTGQFITVDKGFSDAKII